MSRDLVEAVREQLRDVPSTNIEDAKALLRAANIATHKRQESIARQLVLWAEEALSQ
jgi:hypothetical protein